MKRNLLVIDPQIDFVNPEGALPVPGGMRDMNNLAAYIRLSIKGEVKPFKKMFVTLDAHPFIHISHPAAWLDAENNHPAIYTLISLEDVKSGKWRSIYGKKFPGLDFGPMEYVKAVGTFRIWPPHCVIGTKGHAVWEPLMDALVEWQSATGNNVEYALKGVNPYTEQFSVFSAAYRIFEDENTWFNEDLADALSDDEKIDELVVAGEATSHCVKDSILDLVEDSWWKENPSRINLLSDCMSSVKDCEEIGSEFFKIALGKGIRISTTKDG